MAGAPIGTDPALIVGAGPTGLTAALELTRLGIPVRIVDRLEQPATTSRAIGVQARTLELMHQRGLADEMVRLGQPARGGSIYGGGKRIARLDFGHVESRFNFVLLLSQAETERILREAVERQGASIERGVELVGLSQDGRAAPPVTATLRYADGRLEQASASWLIGAEGAHSRVRTTLDLHFEGKTLEESYALGDLHLDGDLAGGDLHIFSSEHGLLAMFPMGGDHFRLIAGNAPEPASGGEPSLEMLQRFYDERATVPGILRGLTWSSWFRINSRMVPRLRVGRLLLGGDAAHVHSPAGGQGMNTGIQDMINLGWKLAMVMKGEAPEALLDTYEGDRLPVIRDVLSKTEGLTAMMGSESAVMRTLTNRLAPILTAANKVQENATSRMSQVAVTYRGSPLATDHHPGGSLHAGDRVPEGPAASMEERGRLQKLLDPDRFTLLVVGEHEGDAAFGQVPAPYAAQVRRQVVLPPSDPAGRQDFEALFGKGPALVLVRPDGYVGAVASGRGADGALADYLVRWLIPADGTAADARA